jgi:exodeoxyribonuclease VII large subunit
MTEKMSLTELQLIIRDSLYISLPDMYWVIAEISELKENNAGHCYIELIEKQPDDKNVRARVKAIIWSSRFRFLKSFFENSTGESIREGIKVLVKVKVEYHELYGLSLVISDIDPAFTLGELALKRQQIIKRLEEEGIINMNKEIEFPVLPQRIAIISSGNAAGYTDFINQLKQNSYGFIFYTALFESPVQGSETEGGVISALEKVAEKIDLFDIVAIIRGGGSQTDLSWFDNYNIAYYVTQFPIPVITGIGHDKDLSVTDLVAAMSLKTPTAVADFLIECFVDSENHMMEMYSEIRDLTRAIIENNQTLLNESRLKLVPLAKYLISERKEKLSEKIFELINFGKEYTHNAGKTPSNQASRLISGVKSFFNLNLTKMDASEKHLFAAGRMSIDQNKGRLNYLESSMKILNPENVLKRGYTITSVKGIIMKERINLKENDIINTRFIDGSVKSRVLPENGRKGEEGIKR